MTRIYNLRPGQVIDLQAYRSYQVKVFVRDGVIKLVGPSVTYSWDSSTDTSVSLDAGRWGVQYEGSGTGAILLYMEYSEHKAPTATVIDGIPTIAPPSSAEFSPIAGVSRIRTANGYVVQVWDRHTEKHAFSAEWDGLSPEQASHLISRLLLYDEYGKSLDLGVDGMPWLWIPSPPNIEAVSINGYWKVQISGVGTNCIFNN